MKDNNLNLLVLILLFAMILVTSCTPESIPQETERLRSHQVKYKSVFIGSQVFHYRSADNGKFTVIGSQVSGMNTPDSVWSETKTTIEKW